MAFYVMHDTFIAQKHNQSVLKSRTNYGLKNVNNDEKQRINFEPKLLLKNFEYERRKNNELVEMDKKGTSNDAKVTKTDTTLRNGKETEVDDNQSFAKKHQLIWDEETPDKGNYSPLASNNHSVNPEIIQNPELKNIEEAIEKCEKEKDYLVYDLNNNKKKVDTSKDLIKCNAQEDITCKKIILNLESSNPDQNNNIQLKQKTEESLPKTTNNYRCKFKTSQKSTEQNEYVEIVETGQITRKNGEESERAHIHLEQTKYDKTRELELEYEETIKVDIEYGKAEYEQTGEVEQMYEESCEEKTKYEVTK